MITVLSYNILFLIRNASFNLFLYSTFPVTDDIKQSKFPRELVTKTSVMGVARHTLVALDFPGRVRTLGSVFTRNRNTAEFGSIRVFFACECFLPIAKWETRWPRSRRNSWRITKIENPFSERISEVFTGRQNTGQSPAADAGGICFEEFLEMMSVFSEQAPRDLKVFYAFKIYDFDEDGVLGLSDLEHTCRQLVQGGLNADEVATVCKKVLEESDIDGDGVLSYLEFEHVVTRASDFMATFHIRI
ncbi:uncharacterized protein LOC116433327 isoform X1 [Nomia melanderi]|uniref:uncharacterized protein LOC116433327 isoform X1 n=1 Tax=Nomia melanderi TaxID=2448451 RepID=UPI003FCC7E01